MASLPHFDPADWLDQFERVGGIVVHYSSGSVAAGYLLHRNPPESRRTARLMLDTITDQQQEQLRQHLASLQVGEG